MITQKVTSEKRNPVYEGGHQYNDITITLYFNDEVLDVRNFITYDDDRLNLVEVYKAKQKVHFIKYLLTNLLDNHDINKIELARELQPLIEVGGSKIITEYKEEIILSKEFGRQKVSEINILPFHWSDTHSFQNDIENINTVPDMYRNLAEGLLELADQLTCNEKT
jgi:hypothetical protein